MMLLLFLSMKIFSLFYCLFTFIFDSWLVFATFSPRTAAAKGDRGNFFVVVVVVTFECVTLFNNLSVVFILLISPSLTELTLLL